MQNHVEARCGPVAVSANPLDGRDLTGRSAPAPQRLSVREQICRRQKINTTSMYDFATWPAMGRHASRRGQVRGTPRRAIRLAAAGRRDYDAQTNCIHPHGPADSRQEVDPA